jgi:hypothetical protein
MLLRSDMSGMRGLAGRRASVATCPLSWAFPTAEDSARYDAPAASGGLSLGRSSSACLPHSRSCWGLPRALTPLCRHATA